MKLQPIYHPHIVDRPVDNHGGPMREHLGLVLHVQVGDNSLYERFNDPATQVSSTWWTAKNGIIERYVPTDLTAWAQAAGNGEYNSVETEGYPNEPLTLAQIAAIAHIMRHGHARYHWPYKVVNRPGRRGLIWHGAGRNLWGGHPDCPGDIRKSQRGLIVALAAGKNYRCGLSDPSRPELDTLKQRHGLRPNGVAGPNVRLLLGL